MISKASAHWSIFKKAHAVLKAFSGYACGTVLDIGCGTKPFREAFQGRVENYFGVDVPSKIVRSNEKERFIEIDIYGDCLDLPVKNGRIDTVFSSFVIEHVFEYDRFFREVYRVLKAKGNFIMISPLIVEVHEPPCDFFRFTEYALRGIAERHRLDVVNIIPIGGEFLFWGNRMAGHIHKWFSFSMTMRLAEVLSYLVQKVSLYLDNILCSKSFACNYLTIFRKMENEKEFLEKPFERKKAS